MSVNTERPGVYTSYQISRVLSSNSGASSIVAVAASAQTGDVMKVYTITSYADAVDNFGATSPITELIKTLMLNGVTSIRAVPVHIGDGALADEYKSAFELIAKTQDVHIVICDSTDTQVHQNMMQSITDGQQRYGYRIGVVEAAGEDEQVMTQAKDLNCERMILVKTITGYENQCAAATAAVIAVQTDPAIPLNGVELKGINAPDAIISDGELTELINAGVMPIEIIGGVPMIVRGITTRTMTDSSQDSTFREINTVLIADNVITTVKNSLKIMFYRAKNNAQTRGAIRTQVIVELEKKIDAQIIDEYSNVSAVQNAEDPTVCDVSFDFTITHGLNRINLTAYITV